MAENVNSYWNGNGKHEEEVSLLNGLMPNWGMTDNKYMNLFILSSKIYYDVYNNGGGNLRDNYPVKIEKYIVPFADDLKSLRLNVTMKTLLTNFKKKEKLEAFLDEVIMYLQDKDLSYNKHIVYYHYDNKELSKEEVEGFSQITFGNEQDYLDWTNHRVGTWSYKWVG